MTEIDFSYRWLLSNIAKRFLLLIAKLAGYKGVAVLIATVLLCSHQIGEAAWASVIISALCGVIVPKAAGNFGNSFSDILTSTKGEQDYEKTTIYNQRASRAVTKPSDSGKRAVENGKQKIREAVVRAKPKPTE